MWWIVLEANGAADPVTRDTCFWTESCEKTTGCLVKTMSAVVFLLLEYLNFHAWLPPLRHSTGYLEHQKNHPNAMNAESSPPPPCKTTHLRNH